MHVAGFLSRPLHVLEVRLWFPVMRFHLRDCRHVNSDLLGHDKQAWNNSDLNYKKVTMRCSSRRSSRFQFKAFRSGALSYIMLKLCMQRIFHKGLFIKDNIKIRPVVKLKGKMWSKSKLDHLLDPMRDYILGVDVSIVTWTVLLATTLHCWSTLTHMFPSCQGIFFFHEEA